MDRGDHHPDSLSRRQAYSTGRQHPSGGRPSSAIAPAPASQSTTIQGQAIGYPTSRRSRVKVKRSMFTRTPAWHAILVTEPGKLMAHGSLGNARSVRMAQTLSPGRKVGCALNVHSATVMSLSRIGFPSNQGVGGKGINGTDALGVVPGAVVAFGGFAGFRRRCGSQGFCSRGGWSLARFSSRSFFRCWRFFCCWRPHIKCVRDLYRTSREAVKRSGCRSSECQ